MTIRSMCFALALAGAWGGIAQAQAQAVQPAIAPAPAGGTGVLRVGTEVPLKLSEELTTKGKLLKVGYRFHLEVAENVLVDGRVVIPAGAPAMGEVTEVRNKGMWGKSGHITARVLYAMVHGRQIRLTGNFDEKGTTGTAGVVGAVAFLPVAGFFTTGTSAKIAIGTPVKAFVDEDVALSFDQPASAPLVVPAATTPTP